MVRVNEFKKAAAERLRALFPQVVEWQESQDATVGDQTVDLLVRLRIGQELSTLICETRSRGEPRYLREAITRLRELRPHVPGAYPIVAAPYVTPQSAALVRRNGCGYLDLSGNCYLAFESVLIQKEGRPNSGLVRRPLKALFAPRATRVVRALLCERERAWRLDELGRAVGVSLGHAHNVIKRLEEHDWLERGRDGLYRLDRPGELLDAWRDEYSYRVNGLHAFVSPPGDKRRVMEALARHATELGMSYAFTLHARARASAGGRRGVGLSPDPVRPGRLLRAGRQGRVPCREPPTALRGSTWPRAARARAGREAPSRCDGVLASRRGDGRR
jgi:hypothetical protein